MSWWCLQSGGILLDICAMLLPIHSKAWSELTGYQGGADHHLPRDNTQLATCSTCWQLLPTHLPTAVEETAWWAQGPTGSDSPSLMAQKIKGGHNPCQDSSKDCLLKPGMIAILHMDCCAPANLQSFRAKG